MVCAPKVHLIDGLSSSQVEVSYEEEVTCLVVNDAAAIAVLSPHGKALRG
jgi:hypothetical protein